MKKGLGKLLTDYDAWRVYGAELSDRETAGDEPDYVDYADYDDEAARLLIALVDHLRKGA